MKETELMWIAYCVSCGELDKAPNGLIIEVIAKTHKRRNLDPVVIIGTYITAEDAVLSQV